MPSARLVLVLTLAVVGCAKEPVGAPPAVAGATGAGDDSAQTPSIDPRTIAQIACGDYHTCARLTDGTVRCWGRNRAGELGDGGTADRKVPAAVPGVSDVTQIALGATFSCALKGDRTVTCWGSGAILNDGRVREQVPPTEVPGLMDVVEIGAGGLMTCARLASGKVRCWGEGAAQPTADVPKASELAVGEVHACARLEKGGIRCWGNASWSRELKSPAVDGAKQIATGDSVACAVVPSGAVRCWGRNEQGQIGMKPDMDVHPKPLEVKGIASAQRVAAGEAHACALVEGGSLACWGANTDGELGRGSTSQNETPGAVKGIAGVLDVAVGANHICARTDAGVLCWGGNGNGQLGDGTTERRLAPTRVKF